MTIDQFLAAHRDTCLLLTPLYAALWSVLFGRMAALADKYNAPGLARALHVLAMSPAPRTRAELVADATNAVEKSK